MKLRTAKEMSIQTVDRLLCHSVSLLPFGQLKHSGHLITPQFQHEC